MRSGRRFLSLGITACWLEPTAKCCQSGLAICRLPNCAKMDLSPWRWRATAHSLRHRMRLNRIAVCSLWRRCSIQRRSRWCLRGSIQPSWRGLNGKLLYQLDYADVQERFEERDIRRANPSGLPCVAILNGSAMQRIGGMLCPKTSNRSPKILSSLQRLLKSCRKSPETRGLGRSGRMR